ncbi:helix-turn-helix domain-containing protein [Candidatus Sulfurimonas baltica]|uniref:Helix-turn-helix transcriptional regulator n=1 Tax=Candidatus Sulfurimonas baltica TaxID=2740404 RepID=A0A7S7RNI9_9BACT|nr:helix-turn-helix transcriptional regulator [Candidatus Sulfurimonas baltica]QOY52483.1 helix-turn-helix transcriptional regulator [Candidatus Sulfurimonas baltica]
MSFEEFTYEFGTLIKQSRNTRGMSLQALALETGIVYDQIQKIESAKHGGVLINTYVKLLSGLKVSLSFTKNDSIRTKLIPVSNEVLIFIDEIFLGLSSDSSLQFLNMNYPLFMKHIGELLMQKRKGLNLTQKQLAKKANISNTTLVHIEGGEHSFRLATLHKIATVLNNR